jgi:hypothetical protein
LCVRFTPTKWGTEETSNLACHARFRDCIESHAPDLVISVHPLCQDIPLRVLTTIGNGRYAKAEKKRGKKERGRLADGTGAEVDLMGS